MWFKFLREATHEDRKTSFGSEPAHLAVVTPGGANVGTGGAVFASGGNASAGGLASLGRLNS